jgi:hypothetical protein
MTYTQEELISMWLFVIAASQPDFSLEDRILIQEQCDKIEDDILNLHTLYTKIYLKYN